LVKIKTVKDVVEVSNKIIGHLVGDKKLAVFNILVDDEEGNVSNCTWTPTSKLADGNSFLAVEDYAKTIIILLTHPRIKGLEYDENIIRLQLLSWRLNSEKWNVSKTLTLEWRNLRCAGNRNGQAR